MRGRLCCGKKRIEIQNRKKKKKRPNREALCFFPWSVPFATFFFSASHRKGPDESASHGNPQKGERHAIGFLAVPFGVGAVSFFFWGGCRRASLRGGQQETSARLLFFPTLKGFFFDFGGPSCLRARGKKAIRPRPAIGYRPLCVCVQTQEHRTGAMAKKNGVPRERACGSAPRGTPTDSADRAGLKMGHRALGHKKRTAHAHISSLAVDRHWGRNQKKRTLRHAYRPTKRKTECNGRWR